MCIYKEDGWSGVLFITESEREGERDGERERAGAANRVTQILLQPVFELGWRWLPFDICCVSSRTKTTHFVSSNSTLLLLQRNLTFTTRAFGELTTNNIKSYDK